MKTGQARDWQTPTQNEQHEFALFLLFGGTYKTDPLRACVNLAYLDMSRTLHGFADVPNKTEIREEAHMQVCTILTSLLQMPEIPNQINFDRWHRNACISLRSFYDQNGFPEFTLGQSQKWINMAFKYVHLLGETRLPGFNSLFGLGHIPIDNIMLTKLTALGASPLSCNWSRLNCYEEYMKLQKWVREKFPDSTPLAVEFHMYQEADL